MQEKNYSANLLDFMSSSEPISEVKKNLENVETVDKPSPMPKKASAQKSEKKAKKQKAASLLKIGNVAKLLDLNTSVLRFWEEEFEELNPIRTQTGQRLYSTQDIAIAKRLKKLLHENGLTLEGAKKLLKKSTLPKGSAYIAPKSGKVKALSLNEEKPFAQPKEQEHSPNKQLSKEEQEKRQSFLKAIELELLEIKKKLI